MTETETGLHNFEKKDLESLSRLYSSEFKLAANKTLGYDMPRVKLNIKLYQTERASAKLIFWGRGR